MTASGLRVQEQFQGHHLPVQVALVLYYSSSPLLFLSPGCTIKIWGSWEGAQAKTALKPSISPV